MIKPVQRKLPRRQLFCKAERLFPSPPAGGSRDHPAGLSSIPVLRSTPCCRKHSSGHLPCTSSFPLTELAGSSFPQLNSALGALGRAPRVGAEGLRVLPGEGEAKGLAAACSTRAQEVAGGPTRCWEKTGPRWLCQGS